MWIHWGSVCPQKSRHLAVGLFFPLTLSCMNYDNISQVKVKCFYSSLGMKTIFFKHAYVEEFFKHVQSGGQHAFAFF